MTPVSPLCCLDSPTHVSCISLPYCKPAFRILDALTWHLRLMVYSPHLWNSPCYSASSHALFQITSIHLDTYLPFTFISSPESNVARTRTMCLSRPSRNPLFLPIASRPFSFPLGLYTPSLPLFGQLHLTQPSAATSIKQCSPAQVGISGFGGIKLGCTRPGCRLRESAAGMHLNEKGNPPEGKL